MTTYMNDLLDNLDLSEFELDDENIDVETLCVDDYGIDDNNSEPHGVFIHTKWILDGADTLSEAAEAARAFADFLDSLQDDGFVLMDTIEDGNGFALAPDSL